MIKAWNISTKILWKAFFVAFILAFTPGVIFTLINNRTGLGYLALPLTVVSFLLVLLVSWWLAERIKINANILKIILICFMVLSAAAQMFIGLRLRFTFAWDIEAIIYGGMHWAQGGTYYDPNVTVGRFAEYFSMFPNQWGSLFFYRILFTVSGFLGNIFGEIYHHDIALM